MQSLFISKRFRTSRNDIYKQKGVCGYATHPFLFVRYCSLITVHYSLPLRCLLHLLKYLQCFNYIYRTLELYVLVL